MKKHIKDIIEKAQRKAFLCGSYIFIGKNYECLIQEDSMLDDDDRELYIYHIETVIHEKSGDSYFEEEIDDRNNPEDYDYISKHTMDPQYRWENELSDELLETLNISIE